MTTTVTSSETDAAAPASVTSSVTLTRRPGRWVDGWNPEDSAFWESEGRPIARRNLGGPSPLAPARQAEAEAETADA